jgi:hypothetical protein
MKGLNGLKAIRLGKASGVAKTRPVINRPRRKQPRARLEKAGTGAMGGEPLVTRMGKYEKVVAFWPFDLKRYREASDLLYAKDYKGDWWNVDLTSRGTVKPHWQVTSKLFLKQLDKQPSLTDIRNREQAVG